MSTSSQPCNARHLAGLVAHFGTNRWLACDLSHHCLKHTCSVATPSTAAQTAIVDRSNLDRLYNQLFWPKRMIPLFLAIFAAVFCLLSVALIALLVLHPGLRPGKHRGGKLDFSGTSTTAQPHTGSAEVPLADRPANDKSTLDDVRVRILVTSCVN